MLQQDYLLRIIREFAEALNLLKMQKKDIRQKEEALLKMYDAYIGDQVFLHTATIDDIMDFFTTFPVEERLDRMEMLAELYYAESDLKSGIAREQLLTKARQLFIFIDQNSKTLSLTRQQRIIEIEQSINKK